jgi:hypothetical protein
VEFTPSIPHISVGVCLTGAFGQFADPLDWIARQFGIDVKVDRVKLAESLAYAGGGPGRASAPMAEALGMDRRTQFRIQIMGRCEGQMVAQCTMTFDPVRMAPRQLEEAAIGITVVQAKTVLGVQATRGAKYQSLPGLEQTKENTVVRLLPLNVLNRSFFEAQIEILERYKKVKALDAGEAVLFELVKPWLFYDVPPSKRKRLDARKALPVFQP